MFEQLEKPEEVREEKKRTDYTGLKIVGMIAPVFLLFVYLDKVDLGLAVSIVLGMTLIAIKIHWDLRKHVWFWATIGFVLAVHFFLIARMPQKWLAALGPLHAAGLLPIGVADLVITLGAIWVAQKLFIDSSSADIEGE